MIIIVRVATKRNDFLYFPRQEAPLRSTLFACVKVKLEMMVIFTVRGNLQAEQSILANKQSSVLQKYPNVEIRIKRRQLV